MQMNASLYKALKLHTCPSWTKSCDVKTNTGPIHQATTDDFDAFSLVMNMVIYENQSQLKCFSDQTKSQLVFD